MSASDRSRELQLANKRFAYFQNLEEYSFPTPGLLPNWKFNLLLKKWFDGKLSHEENLILNDHMEREKNSKLRQNAETIYMMEQTFVKAKEKAKEVYG